jgi:magnesium-transporting ATPase (P-type)
VELVSLITVSLAVDAISDHLLDVKATILSFGANKIVNLNAFVNALKAFEILSYTFVIWADKAKNIANKSDIWSSFSAI